MKSVTKFRSLEKYLVDSGMVATSARARELIQNGAVRVNGAVITSPICPINDEHGVEISGLDCPWVNAEAVRLFDTLQAMKLDLRGRTVLNLGAGAGGFAEVLIQKGAKKIWTVDAEFSRLHSSLLMNPRIKNIQGRAYTSLDAAAIDDTFDLIVADIPDQDIEAGLISALSLHAGEIEIIAFVDDKRRAKEIEKLLRADHRALARKATDSKPGDKSVLWARRPAQV